MSAANELVDIIREIISQELSNKGATELAIVDSVGDAGCYNLRMATDPSTVLYNIPNMTCYSFVSGDACYVYKVENNLANAYICYKKPATGAQNAITNLATDTGKTVVSNTVSVDNDNMVKDYSYVKFLIVPCELNYVGESPVAFAYVNNASTMGNTYKIIKIPNENLAVYSNNSWRRVNNGENDWKHLNPATVTKFSIYNGTDAVNRMENINTWVTPTSKQ